LSSGEKLQGTRKKSFQSHQFDKKQNKGHRRSIQKTRRGAKREGEGGKDEEREGREGGEGGKGRYGAGATHSGRDKGTLKKRKEEGEEEEEEEEKEEEEGGRAKKKKGKDERAVEGRMEEMIRSFMDLKCELQEVRAKVPSSLPPALPPSLPPPSLLSSFLPSDSASYPPSLLPNLPPYSPSSPSLGRL
jgi:TATA-binding protein-associated factor Taf7